ncbi:MAG TPA: glycosyltransferase family 2 protein [Thermoanaerobaculia bacterium]|nr:glycosyltransferase family 2 protein [Thermoanaerobaculia bacterium]
MRPEREAVPGAAGRSGEAPRRPPRQPVGRVAVVLVNWNGAADTLATLRSLDRCAPGVAAAGAEALRPIVVDNGSSDDSAARLRRERPGLELIESGGNLGFAGGNEVGIRRALADPEVGWVLLLNTDVELDAGFLPPLLDACADPGVGAAGPKIFYFDPPDRLWAAGGRLRIRETVTEEFGRGQPDGPRFSRPADVTYLTTCCLLIPRDALERVGPLDPAYFINVDDADWCRRALDAGYRLRYVPESRVWHKVAASSGGAYTPGKTFHTARSNAVYVRRHAGPAGLAGFLAANLAALPVAWLRELARGNTRAVAAKARGLLHGLRDPLPAPPRGLCEPPAARLPEAPTRETPHGLAGRS